MIRHRLKESAVAVITKRIYETINDFRSNNVETEQQSKSLGLY